MSKIFVILISLFFSNAAFAQEKIAADANVAAAPAEDTGNSYDSATVQILNKTNAKTIVADIRLNKKTDFGNISIIARRCWQAPLDQTPESKMLLEIFETRPNQPEKRIFYGWMFASSPSISGLEHPVYDITALNCKAFRK